VVEATNRRIGEIDGAVAGEASSIWRSAVSLIRGGARVNEIDDESVLLCNRLG
jgi:hypothetical protein